VKKKLPAPAGTRTLDHPARIPAQFLIKYHAMKTYGRVNV